MTRRFHGARPSKSSLIASSLYSCRACAQIERAVCHQSVGWDDKKWWTCPEAPAD